MTTPLSTIAHLGPVFFVGRANNLRQRLDALRAIAEAKTGGHREVTASTVRNSIAGGCPPDTPPALYRVHKIISNQPFTADRFGRLRANDAPVSN